jgi:RimJ/RimL family protein N-acetyltransferase
MTKNASSEKVLQKIGMKKEGVLRQYWKKLGVFEDVGVYSILRQEYGYLR